MNRSRIHAVALIVAVAGVLVSIHVDTKDDAFAPPRTHNCPANDRADRLTESMAGRTLLGDIDLGPPSWSCWQPVCAYVRRPFHITNPDRQPVPISCRDASEFP